MMAYNDWLLDNRTQLSELSPGDSITVPRGTTVTYSNPFEQECEYWAVCVPAFSVARAGR